MAPIPESARKVIEAGRLAHLVTLNRDGSPQVSIVWVGIDDDEIVSAHLGSHQKVKNVRRDERVVLSIATDHQNSGGMTEYLVVYGHARITEGGAPELLQQLAYKYIGPGVKFPPMDNPPPGYITRITPDRYAGVGPWAAPSEQH
jgi:PPOX class probable F420-dependent enzyme